MEDYFEPYENLARKRNLIFGSSRENDSFLDVGNYPILFNKFCYLLKGELLFWAFDSYAVKFGMNQTYSGLYRWVKLADPEFYCRLSERFFMDMLTGGKRDKLGIPDIDGKVTLHTSDKVFAGKMVTKDLVDKFLNLSGELTPVEFVVNPGYIPRFKGREEEQLVGLETKRWYSAEELEQYWEELENFITGVL